MENWSRLAETRFVTRTGRKINDDDTEESRIPNERIQTRLDNLLTRVHPASSRFRRGFSWGCQVRLNLGVHFPRLIKAGKSSSPEHQKEKGKISRLDFSKGRPRMKLVPKYLHSWRSAKDQTNTGFSTTSFTLRRLYECEFKNFSAKKNPLKWFLSDLTRLFQYFFLILSIQWLHSNIHR